MAKLKGESWRQNIKNWTLYNRYVNQLLDIAISSFKWKNLPKEIDPRYLETVLFKNGSAVFFKDEIVDEYVASMVSIGGQFDIYGIPTKRKAYAINGATWNLTNKDSVMIYNNNMHKTDWETIEYFAYRLYDLDTSIMINEHAHRTPVMILTEQNQVQTMKNLYQKFEGGEPVIYGNKSLDINSIKVLDTKAPLIFQDLYQQKMNVWNEALTVLGIQNSAMTKSERMNVEEVTASQGGTLASRQSRLKARQRACEQINEMFGLDISVSFIDSEIDSKVKELVAEQMLEVEGDEDEADNVRETIEDRMNDYDGGDTNE